MFHCKPTSANLDGVQSGRDRAEHRRRFAYQTAREIGDGVNHAISKISAGEKYIVRLIGQVITASLETMKIVKSLSELKFEPA